MRELELYLTRDLVCTEMQILRFPVRSRRRGERQAYVDSLCGKIRSYRDTARLITLSAFS